ncbi:MAG: OsmC family protein [Gemmatimonadota bacterium]
MTTSTTETDTIRTKLERNVRAVTLRPGVGQGTATTTARLGPDLTCDLEDGSYTLRAGMTEKYGGDGSAPNPGVFGRAGLASCLAINYAMWAARREVPIDELTVTVEADYDVRGELGVDDSVTPAYLAVRVKVDVRSPAPKPVVEAMLAEGERYSAWLKMFTDPIPVELERSIDTSDGEGDTVGAETTSESEG